MCQLDEVHAHGSKAEPTILLTSVPGIHVTKDVGQTDRIVYAEQMPVLKAGDRIALYNGANRVYTIGTVMDAVESEISIRYDFVNPVGVAVNHGNQSRHRILSQQEFDMIINKVVRGY